MYAFFEVLDSQHKRYELDCNFSAYIKVNSGSANTVERGYPHTIIASDGIVVYKNNSQYFAIDNSGSEQKIIAKGLRTTKDTSMSDGELYSSANFLTKFRNFLSVLETEFVQVRFEGKNDTHQKNISNAITSLSNAITETALIAAK